MVTCFFLAEHCHGAVIVGERNFDRRFCRDDDTDVMHGTCSYPVSVHHEFKKIGYFAVSGCVIDAPVSAVLLRVRGAELFLAPLGPRGSTAY